MALVTLDFGAPADILTKDDVREALAADARLRAAVAGVRPVEVFINSGTIGTTTAYTTTGQPPYAPANGYIWAVMQIGLENSTSSILNVYKGIVPAIATGGKPVIHDGAANVQTDDFSKGQLWLRPGDQLTFLTGGGTILSIFMTAIEIPAERVGELLI